MKIKLSGRNIAGIVGIVAITVEAILAYVAFNRVKDLEKENAKLKSERK